METLPIPDFLAEQTEDTIYERMRAILPADIDSSEGSHVWNFLRPTALVLAEFYEAILPRTLGLIFPKWSYGEFLDAHAEARGMRRKEAVAAEGWVTVTLRRSAQGPITIAAGTRFSTTATERRAPVDYETTEGCTVSWTAAFGGAQGQTKTVLIPVRCSQPGEIGNTTANTVIVNTDRVPEIVSVTNESPITGGGGAEDDTALIARIERYDRSMDRSYVGSVADYQRWALEVDGVGSVAVVPPQNASGEIQIILTDANGAPADGTLCDAVHRHIMGDEDSTGRLAPVNASITVTPAQEIRIRVMASVLLDGTEALEAVQEAFRVALSAYLLEATQECTIRYSRVAAALSSIPGVRDHQNLQIREDGQEYSTGNITISPGSILLPAEDWLTMTEVTG